MYKYFIIFIIGFILFSSCTKTESKNTPKTNIICNAIASASDGLNLGDNPSTTANKIFLLPFNSKVKVLEELDNEIIIDSVIGKWVQIQFGDKSGWVFNAYLRYLFNLKDTKSILDT